MNSFCRAAAKELSGRGIRINTAAFSLVDTDMYREFLDYGDVSILKNTTLGIIRVENAADAIRFLLSDAGRYMTGHIFRMYAGVI